MMEAEIPLRGVAKTLPEVQRLLQQREGADDIALDKLGRSVNRAIDMTFGSKVHYIAWLMLVEQLTQRSSIANVDMREAVAGMATGLRDGIEAGGVGELVDIDHGGSRIGCPGPRVTSMSEAR